MYSEMLTPCQPPARGKKQVAQRSAKTGAGRDAPAGLRSASPALRAPPFRGTYLWLSPTASRAIRTALT